MPEVSQAKSNAVNSNPYNSNPYGLAAVQQTGHTPMMGGFDHLNSAAEEAQRPGSNRAAAVSFLFGFAAIALTLVPSLPGSPAIWIGAASLVAVGWAVAAIVLRVQQRATNAWIPVVSIVFALGAAAVTVLGVNVLDVVNSTTAQLATTASTAKIGKTAPQYSPEPFVFANDPTLTTNGSTVQQIATALNQTFAGGNSTLSDGQNWPASVTLIDTQVVVSPSTALVTVPSGDAFTYQLAPDKKSYSLALTSGDGTEVAMYYSATNDFGFSCPAVDAHCVPTH